MLEAKNHFGLKFFLYRNRKSLPFLYFLRFFSVIFSSFQRFGASVWKSETRRSHEVIKPFSRFYCETCKSVRRWRCASARLVRSDWPWCCIWSGRRCGWDTRCQTCSTRPCRWRWCSPDRGSRSSRTGLSRRNRKKDGGKKTQPFGGPSETLMKSTGLLSELQIHASTSNV